MAIGLGRDGLRGERAGRFLTLSVMLFSEGWRYFVASAAALGIDFALLVGLTSLLGVPYLASAAAGFCAGTILTYFLSVRWIFHHRQVKDRRLELALFFVIGLAGLALNEALLALFVSRFGLGYVIAKVPTAGATFAFNFVARRLILFSRLRGGVGP
ncbi:MAG: GtrA family protein [Caulobacteraceae bacterium]